MLKRWVLLMAQVHKNVVITGKYLDPDETIRAYNILQPLPLFRTKMKKGQRAKRSCVSMKSFI